MTTVSWRVGAAADMSDCVDLGGFLDRMRGMNALNTYWLSRGPGSATEGPYTLTQLRKMHEAGSVTADAIVCRQGEREWMILDSELAALEDTPPSFEDSLRRRDAEHARSYNRAINWITVIICVSGAVPVLGLLAYLLWGVWALVATVLCVMQMSKGQTGAGIQNLIGVWILAPLAIALLQFLSLISMGGMDK